MKVEFQETQYYVSEFERNVNVCISVELTDGSDSLCPVVFDFNVQVETILYNAGE